MKLQWPSKQDIALMYYSMKHPERKYSKEDAFNQFRQDKNVDSKLLVKAIKLVIARTIAGL